MRFILCGHNHSYQLQALLAAFFPFAPITTVQVDEPGRIPESDGEPALISVWNDAEKKVTVTWEKDGRSHTKEEILPDGAKETLNMALARLAYPLLCEEAGFTLPYGIYTGIRPVKNARAWQQEGDSRELCRKKLTDEFLVADDKADLVLRTLETQTPVLDQTPTDSYSLFVFIPFCPSKCKYCSFISKAISNEPGREIDIYLNVLQRELEVTAEAASAAGLKLDTVYIGGGTPTTLSAQQLKRLLSSIQDYFHPDPTAEFTLEAGRPDTLTPEKLQVMRRFGVNRISVNPQTFRHETLRAIGRSHTPLQTLEAFTMARNAGFDNINMDFISALPGEDTDDLIDSLKTALSLKPENITLHTLTVKRAADYRAGADYDPERDRKKRQLAMEMTAAGEALLAESGYEPYYLYRQKNTVGCLENTGWALPGKACAYNIRIMEENQTVLACGANASTKLVTGAGRIIRIFNPKFPDDYEREAEHILEKRRRIPGLMAQTPSGHIPGVPDLPDSHEA